MNNNIGILDPDGENKNPLTNDIYSDEYKKLANIWRKFPAYENAKEYINLIKKHQVLLVVSGTGSGKTVLFPKYALHALDYTGKIAITLPKQIITRSAAEFSSKTLDVELGKDVGYKYRGSPKNKHGKDTKLLYATDGTIVAKLLNDPLLEEFNLVIIDEAHERKVQIDFLLYLLRRAISKRKDLKIIIMSATINKEIFKNYFKDYDFYNLNIGGRTNYPIESIFLKENIKSDDYIKKGIDIIMNIIKNDDLNEKGSHDIMFFVTSSNEAYDVCKVLNYKLEKNKINNNNIFCVEVYAGMNKDTQELAQNKDLYKNQNKYNRKIVITTNVAESSLTIDGIKYVIESGYELLGKFDPILKGRKLDREFISHAQAKQRMGRAGRTEPGICYHLYTQDFFENKMKKFPDPDIRTEDITGECLKLLNNEDILEVPKLLDVLYNFIEPPRENYIKIAISNLNELRAIDNNKISILGNIMSNLNVEPIFGLCIIMARMYNCIYELIDIICMISASKGNMGEIFLSPHKLLQNNAELKENKNLYDKAVKKITDRINKKKKKFKHSYGDHLSIYKVYNTFFKLKKQNKKEDKIHKWCYDNFIKYDTLKKANKFGKRIRSQILNYLDNNNMTKIYENLFYNKNILNMKLEDRIIICLIVGHNYQIAKMKNDNNYILKDSKKIVKIDPKSFLFLNKKLPKNIFYHELFISMGNTSLNIVSKIPKSVASITF
jgi:pre-mRNA-splicing factor ATP-dependent RNA helicase DHX15/PRP43